MVLKADQERVKTLLKDTITLLCRNGLSFKSKFSVEALIGVTLDENDVFLVSISEIIKSEKTLAEEAASPPTSDDESDRRLAVPQASTSRSSKIRRSKSPEPRKASPQRKRPRMKSEIETSEEEEEDEEMHHMQHMAALRARMPIPEDMWDDEDEDDMGSMSSYDESSSHSFPPMHHRPDLPMKRPIQHQQQLQHQQHQQHSQGKQQHQRQSQYMKAESTQGGRTAGEGSGEIVFVKEEPDDSWPPHGAEESPEDGSIHPDSMFSSLVNPAAADTSGLPEEQNFSMPGMEMVPVSQQDGNTMWAQGSQGMSHQPLRQYRPRGGRSGASSSDKDHQQMQQQAQSADNIAHGSQDSQQDDGEEQCVFAVCDYDESEMMYFSNSQQSGSVKKTMYFCQVCGRSFATIKAYNTHKDEHKGIYKFNCNECGTGFSNKGKYDSHMRHHTGERFLCTWCGKAFLSQTGLKRHVKTQHSQAQQQ